MTQFPPSTSIPSQTEHGPKHLMVYFSIQDAYMSLTWATFDYMFSSTHTIIPLQAIMAKQRCFIQSEGNTTGLDFKPSSKNIARRAPPVCATNLCTTDPMDFSSNFRSPICLGIQSPWISLRNSLSSSHDSILAAVDQLSKQAIFIPTHDTITPD